MVRSPSRYVTILPSFVAKFGGSVDKIVLVCHVIKDSYDHSAMFDGHLSNASGDIKYVPCHMTYKEHVIKASRALPAISPPCQVWWP